MHSHSAVRREVDRALTAVLQAIDLSLAQAVPLGAKQLTDTAPTPADPSASLLISPLAREFAALARSWVAEKTTELRTEAGLHFLELLDQLDRKDPPKSPPSTNGAVPHGSPIPPGFLGANRSGPPT